MNQKLHAMILALLYKTNTTEFFCYVGKKSGNERRKSEGEKHGQCGHDFQ
jgi:hypothetical protein